MAGLYSKSCHLTVYQKIFLLLRLVQHFTAVIFILKRGCLSVEKRLLVKFKYKDCVLFILMHFFFLEFDFTPSSYLLSQWKVHWFTGSPFYLKEDLKMKKRKINSNAHPQHCSTSTLWSRWVFEFDSLDWHVSLASLLSLALSSQLVCLHTFNKQHSSILLMKRCTALATHTRQTRAWTILKTKRRF